MLKNLKFHHKILLAASLVVIGAFSLFTLYNDYLQRNSINRNLDGYLNEMGRVTASNIESWLSGRILLVEALAQNLGRDRSQQALESLLEQPVYGKTFMFSYLGADDGSFIMRPDDEMPADYDPRTRPWYKDAISAGGSTLTEPYIDASTNQLIITIASPVREAGRPVGVAAGDLSLDTLVKTINALDFGGMGYAFLVSSNGQILVHPDKSLVMKNLRDLFPQNTPAISSQLICTR